MALGAATQAAITRARLTGQPVPLGASGLVAYPNGSVGTPGGGFRSTSPAVATQPVAPSAPFTAAGVQGLPGSPSGPAVAPPAAAAPTTPPTTQPSWWQQGLNALVPVSSGGYMPPPPAGVGPQPPLNQANPNFTAGIAGLPSSPSGPAVAPPGGFQPPSVTPPTQMPDVEVTAKRYRAQHGLAADDDSAATDALNAASLQAAQQGRTYLQAGPYPTGGNVVANALVAPPTSQAPIMLAPTVAASATPGAATQQLGRYDWPAAMQANALQQQGLY